MARLLLTQSQVTGVLTIGLFTLFTILLFLTGYIHQQRTVTGLQAALKPRLPKPPPQAQDQQPARPAIQSSRILGTRPSNGGHVAYTDCSAAKDTAGSVDWSRLAHIQLVQTHHDMCNAIMVLAELHRMKSPARKLLLFPQSWATEKKAGRGEISDPFLDISRRLMKVAARRYGVELRPISPISRIENQNREELESYSLASAFALTDLDRVLMIETPGILLDAEPLDAILAFTEPAPFAMLHDTVQTDGVHESDLFLIQPSAEVHETLKQTFADTDGLNATTMSSAFPDPLLLDTKPETPTLIRSIGDLHEPEEAAPGQDSSFNATAFLSDVSYIRFSDPKLPGPEYEVPWAEKVAARPKNRDADWTWTKLYGQFEQERMEVCGLGLETWRG